jgi:hypothetical protein
MNHPTRCAGNVKWCKVVVYRHKNICWHPFQHLSIWILHIRQHACDVRWIVIKLYVL